jgi:hypothetical protein
MPNRKITKTTQTFAGTAYRVAGDPEPVAFKTREAAEKRAERLDTTEAIADVYRNPNR